MIHLLRHPSLLENAEREREALPKAGVRLSVRSSCSWRLGRRLESKHRPSGAKAPAPQFPWGTETIAPEAVPLSPSEICLDGLSRYWGICYSPVEMQSAPAGR